MNALNKKSPIRWILTAYFAMGLPFVVLNMVAVLMYNGMGVDKELITFWTSLILLPWTFKFLWSPFLELFGTKKAYVVATQMITGVAFGLVALALGSSHFFAVTIALLAVVAFSGATHDIACDGVYMSELSNSEQSKYIGWQGGFYNIAKIVGTGLLVYLAGVIIRYAGGDASGALPETVRDANRIGWSWVMALVGAIMLIIGVYHIFVLPSGGTKDCRKERSASDVARELTTVLGEFFRKKHIWYCLTFNIPFVVYAVLAYFQPTGGVIISAGIILEYFGYGFGFVGLTLFMMQQVAPGKHQMAHYAFASGIMNFGVMLPGMLSGWVCNMLGGYTLFFIVVTILTIVPLLVTYFVPFKYNDDGSLIAPAVDGALTQGEGTE
ncbi:MFS transporter [uncultured Duncaniella sp.]|uniref:MFS transporter n=1 Tax=uncultured Duncaniella sp. TaxID=2768039 RepID=UPI0025AA2712|nr:MFS transporter [uncultured Duncaniella sp.]